MSFRDATGSFGKTTRPTGDTVSYGYDLAGRMTGVDFSLAGMTDMAIQYDAMGSATKMTGPGTTLSYTYSGTAPTSENYDSGVGFQFANNGAGMRLASATPAGEEFWNYYDSLGRLTLVWYGEGGGANLATFQYDATTNRLMTRVSYDPANGAKHVEASYSYDGAGRLTRVGSQGYDSDGAPADFCAISYAFNAAGNVTKAILDDNANSYLAYQYDALDRLTREQRAGTSFDYLNEYWYDAAGNRTKLAYTHGGSTATTAYQYDDNYRLTKSTKDGTDTTYQWDAAGNLTHKATTSGDTWEYQWDARDKMTKVRKQPNGGSMADVATYTYDPQGRRYEKRTLGGMKLQRYYQDGLTPVVETVNVPSATIAHRSVPGALGNVIQTCNTSTGAQTFYAYDRLGNVLATFDADGAKTAPVMDAFGNVLSGTGQAFGLTTKQFDGDMALYYFNARWYDPVTCLFVSRDVKAPIKEHPYTLAHGNAANFVDTDGWGMGACCVAIAAYLASAIEVGVVCTAAIAAPTPVSLLACAYRIGILTAAYIAMACNGGIPGTLPALPMPCDGVNTGIARSHCCEGYCGSGEGAEYQCYRACMNNWNRLPVNSDPTHPPGRH